ncbi:MAG: leucine zipper domain-containing protein [Pseudomonadota bacterium]
MNSHNNARLTPRGREQMVRAVVDDGLSKAMAARRFNTTARTVTKWVDRFRKLGVAGLRERGAKRRAAVAAWGAGRLARAQVASACRER